MTINDQMTEEEIRIRRAIRSLDDAINSLRLQKSSLAAMLPKQHRKAVHVSREDLLRAAGLKR